MVFPRQLSVNKAVVVSTGKSPFLPTDTSRPALVLRVAGFRALNSLWQEFRSSRLEMPRAIACRCVPLLGPDHYPSNVATPLIKLS